MVISIFFLLALLAVASFATPGTAPIGILLLLFLFVCVVWWIGLVATTRGAPVEALARVKRHEFLGPGGPDDPFADVPYEDEDRR